MFNSYSSNNSVKINAIAGTIMKNYKDSFFKRFKLNSEFADRIFSAENPHIWFSYGQRSVVVLQMMICGDSEVIAELMWKTDFEKLFPKEAPQ